MVEKRSNEGAVDTSDAKKARTDVAAPAAAPVSRPGLSLAALEKAKKALQLQKELKEKLKGLPQLQKAAAAPAAGSAAANAIAAAQRVAQIAAQFAQGPVIAPQALQPMPASAGASGYKAAPLRLDSHGREVDEFGKPVQRTAHVVSTLKVNQQHISGAATVRKSFLDLNAAPPEPTQSEYFDPRMAASGKMDRRKRTGFDFVQEGSFQKQAEMLRLKAQYGDAAMRSRAAPMRLPAKGPIGPSLNPSLAPEGGAPVFDPKMDPNLVPIGKRVFGTTDVDEEEDVAKAAAPMAGDVELAASAEVIEPPEPVPDVEWWDRHLLATGSYEEDAKKGEDGKETVHIKDSKITHYIEHPVPIEPPAEAPPPPPQPLKLTQKELKKLRTQRRQAREKEKQELIRQGLLEPPKPKVKIANLYRVLGEQAVADPTAMEKETRKQMAERQNAHDDRNLARMLTPDERREKKMKKLFDENTIDNMAAVYKVMRLNGQQKFKVDMNAKENHLTGVAMITSDFCLVVVEGCSKSIKRYNKLMLRRIDWTVEPESTRGGDDMDEDGGDTKDDLPSNSCSLVWQGIIKDSSFKEFRVYDKSGVDQVLAILEKHRGRHYWDIALNFIPGEAPAVEL